MTVTTDTTPEIHPPGGIPSITEMAEAMWLASHGGGAGWRFASRAVRDSWHRKAKDVIDRLWPESSS